MAPVPLPLFQLQALCTHTCRANFDFNQYVQHLESVVFSFEKCLNGQNHSLPDSHHHIKKIPSVKFPIPFSLGWNSPYLLICYLENLEPTSWK